MKPMAKKFDSIDSVLNFLREPSPPSCVSSSTSGLVTSTGKHKNISNISTQQRKEKDLASYSTVTTTTPTQHVGDNKIQQTGRIRYGPITINPRKKPSKTLFTGRRSKYEVLPDEEEEKRRVRRDRNRVAATKCREKRENVLDRLENEHNNGMAENTRLSKLLDDLEYHKKHLESLLSNHLIVCPLQNDPTPMVFGNSGFLSNTIELSAPPCPPPLQPVHFQLQDEELSNIIETLPLLTNSAYNAESDIFIPQQHQPLAPMNTSSIERLLNSLTPPMAMSTDNNNCQMLFNSAANSSSCARQHSSSSEDDSLPPKRTNPYVY